MTQTKGLDMEHCSSCGYTKKDAEYHGDHRLCRNAGKAPWEKRVDLNSPAKLIDASPIPKVDAEAKLIETAKALELLCRFVAGTDRWESKRDEMLEMARRQLGKEKG